MIVRTPNGNLFGTTIAGGGYIIAHEPEHRRADTSGIDFQADYRLALEDVGAARHGLAQRSTSSAPTS